MKLAAPSIVGAVSRCSTTVRLQAQLSKATVELEIGGSTVPLGIADWPDQTFALPVGTSLPVGRAVRARQRLGPDASAASTVAAMVQDVVATLPPPMVAAPVVGCAALLVVAGLSPDAAVTVRDASGTVVGSGQAAGPFAAIKLGRSLAVGEVVDVEANACGTVVTTTSPAPEPMAPPKSRLDPPFIHPVHACQRLIEVERLRPGSKLVMERGDGSTVTYDCERQTLTGRVDPPFEADEPLVFHVEASRRCRVLPSDPVNLTAVSGPPPAPWVSTPPCPGSPQLVVGGLIPSARARVRRGAEELLVFEAAATEQPVDLAGVSLAPGDRLVVEQAVCADQWGPSTPVDTIVTLPDQDGHLGLVRPVADCALVVRVTGVAPGSLVSVFSSLLGGGRIGHALATADTVDVAVSPALLYGDRIRAVVEGCAAGSAEEPVEQVPDLTPDIARAVEGETAVDVSSVRAGAVVDVRVAGAWVGSAVAATDTVRVGVTPPLVVRRRVQATARWCASVASGDGRLVEKRRPVSFVRTSTKGIRIGGTHFNAGRVQAIAPLGAGRAVLGTEASGLWLLQPGIGATSLSDSWSETHIRCLRHDPTSAARWFAGTGSGLLASDPAAAQPEVNWSVLAGWTAGAVNDVLVLPGQSVLVVATDAGVWWGSLANLATTAFISPDPLVNTGVYGSLAMGPGESVIAYRRGDGAAGGRVHVGTWTGGQLVWADRTFETPPGGDGRLSTIATNMGNGSLATCAADRTRAYLAVADQRDDAWFPVLRSDDGGLTWSIPRGGAINELKPAPSGGTIDMGYQAERNMVVAAHPTQRDTVLLGARRSGILGSTDAAATWDVGRWPARGEEFHADVLCLLFDDGDPSGNTVWAGSDGGVYSSTDLGVTWNDDGNAGFPTLMFDLHGASAAPALSANPAAPDVLVGGLQDNGLVVCAAPDAEWTSIVGGDGQRAKFVADNIALLVVNDTTDVRWATWDGTTLTRRGAIVPGGLTAGTFNPIVSRVPFPVYRRGGHRMVAVAGDDSPSGKVFGLFDTKPGSMDDDRLAWELLATVPFEITGIAAWDGRTIVVTTTGPAIAPSTWPTGRYYRVDAGTGGFVECLRFALDSRGGARWPHFLDAGTVAAVDDYGVVATTNLVTWLPAGNVAGGGQPWTLTVDRGPSPAMLLLGRSDGVWTSTDLGATWAQAGGLPVFAEVCQSEVVEGAGRRVCHVGTWNWSAWSAELQ